MYRVLNITRSDTTDRHQLLYTTRINFIIFVKMDILLQIATAESLADRAHSTRHASMLHVAQKGLLQGRLCNASICRFEVSMEQRKTDRETHHLGR